MVSVVNAAGVDAARGGSSPSPVATHAAKRDGQRKLCPPVAKPRMRQR